MSDARRQILAALRAHADRAPPRRSGPPPRPAVAGDLVEAFAQRLAAVAGQSSLLPGIAVLGPAVADYLTRHELGNEIVVAPHPLLDRVAWPAHLVVHCRAAAGTDRVALTVAFAGVAETGSLVMVSGAETPTTLNFLPEHCLVVLDRARLVANLEDAWMLLRGLGAFPPRAVNLVTGPSRTADVEQTIQLGAHGPRRLQVYLVP